MFKHNTQLAKLQEALERVEGEALPIATALEYAAQQGVAGCPNCGRAPFVRRSSLCEDCFGYEQKHKAREMLGELLSQMTSSEIAVVLMFAADTLKVRPN